VPPPPLKIPGVIDLRTLVDVRTLIGLAAAFIV
jgi:hypothetical protein